MDHARRKFVDAFKTTSSKEIGKRGIEYFKKLYQIEDVITDFSPDEKIKIRAKKSKPLLEEIKKWVDEKRKKVPPQSVGAKAINYFHNEYPYLIRYLENGNLRISNCEVENKIRPHAQTLDQFEELLPFPKK